MPKNIKLIAALVTVAIVWGTTYLGIRVAVHSIPPWYVTGIRQSIAALLLFGIVLYTKKLHWIGWKNCYKQLLFAVLMIVIANGMTTVAEQHISSSLAALLSATNPLLVFSGSVLLGFQTFTYKSLLGLGLGFVGVLLLFWDGIQDLANPEYVGGIVAMFIAILGWTSGTLLTKKQSANQIDIVVALFYQFTFAAIIQLAIAFATEPAIHMENWETKSIVAMVYLAVFGSVLTYFAFHYALKRVTPTQVSVLSYINTVIAIYLGWLILDEKITVKILIATLLIISGVFITNSKQKLSTK